MGEEPAVPRRTVLLPVAAVAAVVAAAAAGLPAVPDSRAQSAPADSTEMRVFEADLGPAWIDVSAYPPAQQKAYALFAQRCCKCHTLARPVNSTLKPEDWDAYVQRMSRKPGSGISPADAGVIRDFLVFDGTRRARRSGIDPELVPFLKVSRELSGVERFPACLRDIRPAEDGTLRVRVAADPRADLSRFVAADDGQKLVKWSRRAAHEGEIVRADAARPGKAALEDAAAPASAAVVAAATDAVGDAADPRERVERILDFLDEEMAREHRPGTADAAAVLADPRGDATEFTRLFVAMCRAAGVPARPCAGLVARRTSFHASVWAEVLLDGTWVEADPYLGQLPADLTHVRVQGAAASGAWDAARAGSADRLRLHVDVPEDVPGAG